MKNMRFALTTTQVADQTKDVTRRMGWTNLLAGQQFQPFIKCMGLKPGQKVQPIGAPVTTVSNRREPLRRMIDQPDYGRHECIREGFPHMTPEQFVHMYCQTHKGCTPETEVSRIEFSYQRKE